MQLMLLEIDTSNKAEKINLVLVVVFAFALLLGVSLTARADPYKEGTAGREPVVGLSYFGTHFNRLVLNPGEKNLQTRWPESSIGALRLWDAGTLWSEIAILPGQWKYAR